MSESSGFVHREPVRFRDLDGMGHVNNAVFSTYLEQARLAWFSQERFGAVDELPLGDVILARTEIDFRSPVDVGETVEISVRPTRVGTKSFELAYELHAGGRLVAEAKSVLVGYDYGTHASVPLPDETKRRLSE